MHDMPTWCDVRCLTVTSPATRTSTLQQQHNSKLETSRAGVRVHSIRCLCPPKLSEVTSMHQSLKTRSLQQQSCCCPRQAAAPAAALAAAAGRSLQQRSWSSVIRPAVERDVDWDPAIQRKGALMAPPRGTPPPPPPPPQPPKEPAVPWYEVPFASRRNIVASMLIGTAGIWVWNKKVLPPVQIGDPPADFPFKLAGYTDVDPSDFVYAKTPGGNWIAAAQDMRGRVYIIDQAGDLYYDTGNPDIGIYAVDTQGNLFNIYMEDNKRRITPVGNISEMKQFKVSEIAGVKLDREVNVVAMADGQVLPLPPNSGYIGPDGKFIPPGEIVEGLTAEPEDNPFARLFNKQPRAVDIMN